MQIYGEQLNNAILADREQKKTHNKRPVSIIMTIMQL